LKAEPYRPGSIGCVQRGLRSLRANWELVPLLVGQSVLTTTLVLAGVFLLLTALGVGVVAWLRGLGPDWPQRLSEDLVVGLEATPPALRSLVLPVIAASLVWTLAFVLYCYLQGGVVGILAKSESQAGAGIPAWRSFRRFSAAGFDLQGRRLFWRYFWLNHLLGAVLLVWALLAAGLAGLATRFAIGPDPAVGVALGCSGLVPLGLLLFVVALWSMLATVEVARPGSGVWPASRRAVSMLRRRAGSVLLIWLLALCAWLVTGAAFMPFKWGVALVLGDRCLAWLGARGVMALLEILVNGALMVALLATLSALVGQRPAVEAEV
jgi:hypothetical protein